MRTYVNGTLYSILVKAALKEKALEIGLPDSLRALIEHSDETFARQINYILEQLEKPPVADDDGAASDGEDADDDEEEPDEDDDGEDEEEVDVFAEVALPLDSTDGLSGEELLAANYLAAVQEAQRDASAAAADDAARREQAAQQAARRRQQEEAEAAAEAGGGRRPEAAPPHPRPRRAAAAAVDAVPNRDEGGDERVARVARRPAAARRGRHPGAGVVPRPGSDPRRPVRGRLPDARADAADAAVGRPPRPP